MEAEGSRVKERRCYAPGLEDGGKSRQAKEGRGKKMENELRPFFVFFFPSLRAE